MKRIKDTKLYVHIILKSIEDILTYMSNKGIKDFEKDKFLQAAVLYKLERIFETIKVFPDQFQEEFKFLDLKDDFFHYRVEINFETVNDLIPKLLRLKSLIKELPIIEIKRQTTIQSIHEQAIFKTQKDVLNFLKENKKLLEGTFFVSKIGVFGSFSRDEPFSDSDIDILVTFTEQGKTYSNFMKLLLYLEDVFERKVDLVKEEFLKEPIKENILEEVQYA